MGYGFPDGEKKITEEKVKELLNNDYNLNAKNIKWEIFDKEWTNYQGTVQTSKYLRVLSYELE